MMATNLKVLLESQENPINLPYMICGLSPTQSRVRSLVDRRSYFEVGEKGIIKDFDATLLSQVPCLSTNPFGR